MYCNVLEFNVKKAPLKCARKSAGAASWAGKKLWKSPSRPRRGIVMCRFIKSLTYCSLEGLCVWKYLAGSRRPKERYLAEIKRDRKAQCNWNAFNSFKLFPFQSTRAKVKRGTKHF